MAKVTEVVKEIAQTWQKLAKEDRTKYKEAEIPKNTIVAVVSDESGEWSGTEEKS
jgi:hypothetical protein